MIHHASLPKQARFYSQPEINVFHRKNDVQYSSFVSRPHNACFGFTLSVLEAFNEKGFQGAKKLLENGRKNPLSKLQKKSLEIQNDYRSIIDMGGITHAEAERCLFLQNGFLPLRDISYFSGDEPVRFRLSEALAAMNPGTYAVKLEGKKAAHELGFIRDADGKSYLIDANRGIRVYETSQDIQEDLGKQYPENHPKHIAGKNKYAYFAEHEFSDISITPLKWQEDSRRSAGN